MPSNPQVVVITGASAGVGRATVRAFARRGAHIGLMARGSDGLDAAQREVEEVGGVVPTAALVQVHPAVAAAGQGTPARVHDFEAAIRIVGVALDDVAAAVHQGDDVEVTVGFLMLAGHQAEEKCNNVEAWRPRRCRLTR